MSVLICDMTSALRLAYRGLVAWTTAHWGPFFLLKQELCRHYAYYEYTLVL